jgi:hypothetical protein
MEKRDNQDQGKSISNCKVSNATLIALVNYFVWTGVINPKFSGTELNKKLISQ